MDNKTKDKVDFKLVHIFRTGVMPLLTLTERFVTRGHILPFFNSRLIIWLLTFHKHEIEICYGGDQLL